MFICLYKYNSIQQYYDFLSKYKFYSLKKLSYHKYIWFLNVIKKY